MTRKQLPAWAAAVATIAGCLVTAGVTTWVHRADREAAELRDLIENQQRIEDRAEREDGRLHAEMAGLREDAREDQAALRGEIAGLRTEMTGEIEGLRTEMTGEIEGLRTEMIDEIAGLRTEMTGEIAGLRTEMTGEIEGLRTEMTEARDEIAKVNETVLELVLEFGRLRAELAADREAADAAE